MAESPKLQIEYAFRDDQGRHVLRVSKSGVDGLSITEQIRRCVNSFDDLLRACQEALIAINCGPRTTSEHQKLDNLLRVAIRKAEEGQ